MHAMKDIVLCPCGVVFFASKWRVDKGEGKYHSRSCSYKYMRASHMVAVEFNGKSVLLRDLARDYNLTLSCLKHRVRAGLPIDIALTTPVRSDTTMKFVTHGAYIGIKNHRSKKYLAMRGLVRQWKMVKKSGAGRFDPKWEDFRIFESEIPQRPQAPTKPHTLKKINESGIYEKGNVVWVPMHDIVAEKISSIMLEINGKSMSVREAAKICGIPANIIRTRLENGWTPWRAINTAKQGKRNKFSGIRHIITINGKSACIKEWEREMGMGNRLISSRIAIGWSDEDAVLTPVGHRRPNRMKNAIKRTPRLNKSIYKAKIGLKKSQRAAGMGKYPTLYSLDESPVSRKAK